MKGGSGRRRSRAKGVSPLLLSAIWSLSICSVFPPTRGVVGGPEVSWALFSPRFRIGWNLRRINQTLGEQTTLPVCSRSELSALADYPLCWAEFYLAYSFRVPFVSYFGGLSGGFLMVMRRFDSAGDNGCEICAFFGRSVVNFARTEKKLGKLPDIIWFIAELGRQFCLNTFPDCSYAR